MGRTDPRLPHHPTGIQRTHRRNQQPPSPTPRRPRVHQPQQLRRPRNPRNMTPHRAPAQPKPTFSRSLKKKGGRQNPKRNHPLPETSHRPRDLPPAHQPTKNTQRQRPTLPTPPSPGNPYPRRSSAPHPSKSDLSTRTRPTPQPPTSHPLSKMPHRERSTTKPHLTTIGASHQTGSVQVTQLRELPNPSTPIRPETQLGPTPCGHSPVKPEEPLIVGLIP